MKVNLSITILKNFLRVADTIALRYFCMKPFLYEDKTARRLFCTKGHFCTETFLQKTNCFYFIIYFYISFNFFLTQFFFTNTAFFFFCTNFFSYFLILFLLSSLSLTLNFGQYSFLFVFILIYLLVFFFCFFILSCKIDPWCNFIPSCKSNFMQFSLLVQFSSLV